jgi:long-chain fatty acid transport protein
VIQDQQLRTYFITPSVGLNLYKYVPGLSIGGGVDIVPATVELEQALVFGDVTGTAHLGGDAIGIGGRVGVMYQPPSAPGVKVGIMWRSDIDLDFSGMGDFDIADPYRQQLPPDGEISTSITLPQSVWGGVAYAPIKDLEFEFDAVWINWDKFNEIRIELPMGAETVSPQLYHNTTTLRLGGEYQVPKWKSAFRAGFIYDPTPIPPETQTARLPDVNRKNVTLGASKYWGNYAAHFGFLWVIPESRASSDKMYMPVFKATYDVQALVASLTLSAQF